MREDEEDEDLIEAQTAYLVHNALSERNAVEQLNAFKYTAELDKLQEEINQLKETRDWWVQRAAATKKEALYYKKRGDKFLRRHKRRK